MAVRYLAILAGVAAGTAPNIVHIVADDLGYDDIGHDSLMGNGGLTFTPHINSLIDNGVALHEYYTFKVCSPSRASMLTGRYPWRAGFYDMSDDHNHCASRDHMLLPAALKQAGNYATHALGKWDVGHWQQRCTPTFSGFDSFLGYYSACTADYWYHFSSEQCGGKGPYTDLANSTKGKVGVSSLAVNGTYNAKLFQDEAMNIIQSHDQSRPLYLYLAPQNVHLACGKEPGNTAVKTAKPFGLQASCDTVDLYPNAATDLAKVQSAMITELDYVVGNVTAALQRAGMWENTVLALMSDNGAQMDHGFNAPLRGGKHTFWEGGVRVVSFVSSPLLPTSVRGTIFGGMAHSADWYATFVEGVAGASIPSTGPTPMDSLNLWAALISGKPSPRNEVVHAISSQYFDADQGITYDADGNELSKGNCDGSCGRAIRVGKWKLILGDTGDERVLDFPAPKASPTAFGQSGGYREEGTDHCRAPSGHTSHGTNGTRLFDLELDLNESTNLAHLPEHADTIAKLIARLEELGKQGPPAAYLYTNSNDETAAKAQLCTVMEDTGFLQPGDLPRPGPTPAPPPAPAPAQHQCSKAGGLLGKDGKACCAATCGRCGGKSCGKLPGGNEQCCQGHIEQGARDCRTDQAPCVVSGPLALVV